MEENYNEIESHVAFVKILRVIKELISKECTIEDLSEIASVSTRTIYRYFKTLKKLGYPLQRVEKTHGIIYFYIKIKSTNKTEMEESSINLVPVSKIIQTKIAQGMGRETMPKPWIHFAPSGLIHISGELVELLGSSTDEKEVYVAFFHDQHDLTKRYIALSKKEDDFACKFAYKAYKKPRPSAIYVFMNISFTRELQKSTNIKFPAKFLVNRMPINEIYYEIEIQQNLLQARVKKEKSKTTKTK